MDAVVSAEKKFVQLLFAVITDADWSDVDNRIKTIVIAPRNRQFPAEDYSSGVRGLRLHCILMDNASVVCRLASLLLERLEIRPRKLQT